MIKGKNELRKELIEKRKNLGGKDQKCRVIEEQCVGRKEFQNAQNIYVYISFASEVSTSFIITEALRLGKSLFAPRCRGESMDFWPIQDLNALEKSSFGVLEPIAGKIPEDIDRAGVCIVPGLAFDQAGFRLGYGRGYYDRFLADNPGLFTVGLCYEELFVEDLPRDEHDLPVDMVITQKTIRHVARSRKDEK